MKKEMNNKVKLFLLGTIMLGMITASYLLDFEALIAFSEGSFAPVIFVLITIAGRMLFAPGAIFATAGGALFGTTFGALLAIIAAIISGMIAFFLGRLLGKDFIDKVIGKQDKISKLNNKLEKRGFVTVFLLRLIPVLPYTGLNLSLGVTKVKAKDYFFATCLGVIPGVLVYSNLGEAFLEFDPVRASIALGLVIVLGVVSWYYRKKTMAKTP